MEGRTYLPNSKFPKLRANTRRPIDVIELSSNLWAHESPASFTSRKVGQASTFAWSQVTFTTCATAIPQLGNHKRRLKLEEKKLFRWLGCYDWWRILACVLFNQKSPASPEASVIQSRLQDASSRRPSTCLCEPTNSSLRCQLHVAPRDILPIQPTSLLSSFSWHSVATVRVRSLGSLERSQIWAPRAPIVRLN